MIRAPTVGIARVCSYFQAREVLQKRTPYLGCFILEGLALRPRTADDLYDLSICLVPVPPGLV